MNTLNIVIRLRFILIFLLINPILFQKVFADTDNPIITLETSEGFVTLELDSKAAPITVKNFLHYVNSGFYNGTIFHRVIKDFMIQGGGFNTDMVKKKTQEPIQNEADNGLKNKTGTIAMARTNDPHSATSQFFINTVDNDFLNHKDKNSNNWGYCVFGKVIKGMDTIKAIQSKKTTTRGAYQNVPVTPVIIKKAFQIKKK